MKVGDTLRCVDRGTNLFITVGKTYEVVEQARVSTFIRIKNDNGVTRSYRKEYFKVEPEAKTGKRKAPFGQIKAVTVNHSDVLHALTAYVNFTLGLHDVTVTKLIEKFPEAVELVLSEKTA